MKYLALVLFVAACSPVKKVDGTHPAPLASAPLAVRFAAPGPVTSGASPGLAHTELERHKRIAPVSQVAPK